MFQITGTIHRVYIIVNIIVTIINILKMKLNTP